MAESFRQKTLSVAAGKCLWLTCAPRRTEQWRSTKTRSFWTCYSHTHLQVVSQTTCGGSAAKPGENLWPTETDSQATAHHRPPFQKLVTFTASSPEWKRKQLWWDTTDLGQFRQLWVRIGCRKTRGKLAAGQPCTPDSDRCRRRGWLTMIRVHSEPVHEEPAPSGVSKVTWAWRSFWTRFETTLRSPRAWGHDFSTKSEEIIMIPGAIDIYPT